MTFLMDRPEIGKNENAVKAYIQNCIQKYIDFKVQSAYTELFENNSSVKIGFTISKKPLPLYMLETTAERFYVIDGKYSNIYDKGPQFITKEYLLKGLKEYCFILEIN